MPGGKLIAPKELFGKVQDMALGEKQEFTDMDNGWVWLSERNVQVGGQYFILSFGFFYGVLRMVHMLIGSRPYSLESLGLEDWSEEEQLERARYYHEWLDSQVGPQREFPWGNIWSGYDAQSKGSSIIIRY